MFFHSIARTSQPDVQTKGDNPLTEHYSVLGPRWTPTWRASRSAAGTRS